jgi:hypothetical protein
MLLSFRFQRGIRTLEQTAARTSREFDIRQQLREWDKSYPEIHHEMIVRWVGGALASLLATTLWNALVHPRPPFDSNINRRNSKAL